MFRVLRLEKYCLRFAPVIQKRRYDIVKNINNAIMSSHKHSLNETSINGGAVKKFCSRMNLIEKNMVEILETPDKPEFDKKSYRVIRLENGIKALLISDPVSDARTIDFSKCKVKTSDHNESGTMTESSSSDEENSDSEAESDAEDHESEKMSAFCLSIGVGSYSDPRDIQGLSHFLEHMIFMGSEKYPNENEIDGFLKKGGGYSNAATNYDDTEFHFEVREQCLDGALDRFTQIFKHPLMLKEAMTREREAVEAEFTSKKNNDRLRRDQIFASIAKENHPFSIFSWGNSKTLKDNIADDKLYERVHEYRRRHYSANRMNACIQARMTLDELQDLIVKHLSTIPNNHLSPVDFSHLTYEDVYQSKFHEKAYFVKPVKNVKRLDINWCIPVQSREYKTKQFHYLSFILGWEGKGSLTSYLRKKLWATDLTSGLDDDGPGTNSLFSMFGLGIVLTDDGFDHLDDVIDAIFAYLRLLKHAGPNEKLYREIAKIEENSFRFTKDQDAVDNVQELIDNLRFYPTKDLLTGDSLYYEYDRNRIQQAIDIVNTNKFNIMVTSTKKYDEGVLYDKEEVWFGTEYTERDLPENWIRSWNSTVLYPEFTLPESNTYIAEDFSILYDKSQTVPKYPVKVLENDICELWYRLDDKFLLPHAQFNFYFMTPLTLSSTQNKSLTVLFATLLKYDLVEKLYPATVAGIEYGCFATDRGIVLKTSGYNEKLHYIIEEFARGIKSLAEDISEDEFKTFVQQQYKVYSNIFQKPSAIGNELRLTILEKYRTPLTEKNQLLKTITYNDFRNFCRDFTKEMKIKAIIQGNISQERATQITEKLLQTMNCGKVNDPSSYELLCNKIPLGASYLRVNTFNPKDVNSYIVNIYQIGQGTHRSNALLELLMQIAEDVVFDVLRNKEQLGYSVSCSLIDNYGILSYKVVVESQENKYSADYVDERIENFRKELLSTIEKMSEHDFEQFKASLEKIKLQEDNKLGEEISRNWIEITTDDYVFDRNIREVNELKTITKEELMKFYRDHSGNKEQKLSTQIIGNPNAASETDAEKTNDVDEEMSEVSFDELSYADFKIENNGFLIKDLLEFKSSLDTYPVIKGQ